MRLDRATLNRLGVAAGGYNVVAKQVVSLEQHDNSKAEKAITNKTPIHPKLAPIVETYMQRVQEGKITMEEAAEFINQLPSAQPEVKKVANKTNASKKPRIRKKK